MWTPTTRKQHIRKTNRYQTDVTDEEWRVIEHHLPAANSTGRPRAWPMREIINGIFYVMRAGCPWRLLPSDLPPWNTIYRWFAKFRDEDRFEKINHTLVMLDRERVGRQAGPTGTIIDSQSVQDDRGWRAARLKINGCKRYALVDTDVIGRTTKIQAIVDSKGRPLNFTLTGGHVHDSQVVEEVLDTPKTARYHRGQSLRQPESAPAD
jgi:transposase